MPNKTKSEEDFKQGLASVFLDENGSAKMKIEIQDFKKLKKEFGTLPDWNTRFVFQNIHGEESLEVHGVRKNDVEVYEVSAFHGKLFHILAIPSLKNKVRPTSS